MMASLYPVLKSLHIICVIVWMAGILMYPRLKIYQLNDAPGGKLFEEMKLAGVRMRRIIMTPAMIGTWVFGLLTCLLYTSPSPRDQRGSRMPSSA